MFIFLDESISYISNHLKTAQICKKKLIFQNDTFELLIQQNVNLKIQIYCMLQVHAHKIKKIWQIIILQCNGRT